MTVGTHEQQFDRLVKAVDELVANREITENVFIQTGFSDYEPAHCAWTRFLAPADMRDYMERADVVITHGGPSSFIEAIAAGKTPVVVPRKSDRGEHINDHQVEFVRKVADRQIGIIPVFDIDDLAVSIEEARTIGSVASFQSHNAVFCEHLRALIEDL